MDKLVKGGQGRTSEEVEALGEEAAGLVVAGFIVLLAWFAFMALSS